MKTEQQEKFEELIMQLLNYVPCKNCRAAILEDFEEYCDLYYEVFCDNVFQMIQNPDSSTQELLIDELGHIHQNEELQGNHHMYLKVLTEKDFTMPADDIIVYINKALEHLEEQVRVIRYSVKQ